LPLRYSNATNGLTGDVPRRAMHLIGHTDPTLTLAVYQQVLDMGKGLVELLEHTLGSTPAAARAVYNGEATAAEILGASREPAPGRFPERTRSNEPLATNGRAARMVSGIESGTSASLHLGTQQCKRGSSCRKERIRRTGSGTTQGLSTSCRLRPAGKPGASGSWLTRCCAAAGAPDRDERWWQGHAVVSVGRGIFVGPTVAMTKPTAFDVGVQSRS